MRIAVITVLTLFAATTATAATYQIEPDGSGDFPTIQAAINAAANGDVIQLAAGTFIGDGNRDVDFLGKAVTVRGAGASASVIDCQGGPLDMHYGFTFHSGEDNDSIVESLTVRNGFGLFSGGIFINLTGSQGPTIRECIFSSNHSLGSGGAIHVSGDGLAIDLSDCRFEDNSAAGSGGAIYFDNTDCHGYFDDCWFEGNSASSGGAIACSTSGWIRWRYCTFIDNEASGNGGAVDWMTFDAPLYFIVCTFTGNTAGGHGGAIYEDGGNSPVSSDRLQIDSCEFWNNEAGLRGGAVYSIRSMVFIHIVTFVGNSAGERAGAVAWCYPNDLNIRDTTANNCTFAENSAPIGSSIWTIGSQAGRETVISDTIIAFGTGGSAVACSGDDTIDISCTDIYGNEGGDWVDCLAGLDGVDGNFSANPRFADPANGDYRLTACSPCLDVPDCYNIGALGGIAPRLWEVPGDFPTIQAAVDGAAPCDTIILADGLHAGAGNRDVLLALAHDRLTIRSASGDPALCTIDCGGSAAEPHRAFVFDEGPAGHRLAGVTITGGYHDNGGGILCTLTEVDLVDCVFEGNTATSGGGGLYVGEGDGVTVTDCAFNANTAARGGGIQGPDGTLSIALTTFRNNSATLRGGGINAGSGDVVMTACTLFGNGSLALGGGIAVNSFGSAVLMNTIVAFGTGGGAVACEGTGTASLSCCDLYGNAGGDYVDCLAGLEGTYGNISADPLFCDAAGGDLSLDGCSPCLDAPGCAQIGAFGAGCDIESNVWHVPGDAPTIQAGLDMACAGDTVVVACGTYYEAPIFMKSGVYLKSETGLADCVTLDADGQQMLLHCGDTGSGTVIEGFGLTGGVSHLLQGAALRCTGSGASTVDVRDCVVYGFTGTGVSLVWCDGTSLSISNSAFVGNTSDTYMIRGEDGELTMTHCLVVGNQALAMVFDADSGGGNPIQVTNCTFAWNTGNPYLLASLHETGLSHIDNTIIAFNESSAPVFCPYGEVAPSCCDIYGNTGGDYVGSLAGLEGVDGNISIDPLFCDPGSLDFSISEFSMCAPAQSGCGLIGGYGPACSITAVEDPAAATPRAFRVGPAVPNPFNPVTEIAYEIPAAARVSVIVFDARGRVVRRLHDARQAPGAYTARWDGTCEDGARASSGAYLCRIAWNGKVESRRLLLLK